MIGLVEKVYHRYVGEHGQRQRHLRESQVDMITLSWAMLGDMESKGEESGEQGAAAKGAKGQRGWVSKMAGLYRVEPMREVQPSP